VARKIFFATFLVVLFFGVVCDYSFGKEYSIRFRKDEITASNLCWEDNRWEFKLHVSWDLYEILKNGAEEKIDLSKVSNLEYKLYLWKGENFTSEPVYSGQENFYSLDYSLGQDEILYSYVEAKFDIDRKNGLEASSDTARSYITGLESRIKRPTGYYTVTTKNRAIWALNLALHPALILRSNKIPQDARTDKYDLIFVMLKAMDNSGLGGIVSFIVVRLCFIIGIIAWIMSIVVLRLGAIFPFKKNWFKSLRWFLFFSNYYKNRISDEFEANLNRWKELIAELNDSMKETVEKIGDTEVKLDLDQEAIRIWNQTGMEKKFDEVIENFKNMNKDMKKNKEEKYPIINILLAGLKNNRKNGISWFKASEEVDRAMESRAHQEIEKRRTDSLVEWLWYVICLSPIAGLFGTVTGISTAFKKLGEQSSLGKTMGVFQVINQLGPSINEALWTTIFGLAVAMLLMIPYSYYNWKIDWIYSKWERIYTGISEEL